MSNRPKTPEMPAPVRQAALAAERGGLEMGPALLPLADPEEFSGLFNRYEWTDRSAPKCPESLTVVLGRDGEPYYACDANEEQLMRELLRLVRENRLQSKTIDAFAVDLLQRQASFDRLMDEANAARELIEMIAGADPMRRVGWIQRRVKAHLNSKLRVSKLPPVPAVPTEEEK